MKMGNIAKRALHEYHDSMNAHWAHIQGDHNQPKHPRNFVAAMDWEAWNLLYWVREDIRRLLWFIRCTIRSSWSGEKAFWLWRDFSVNFLSHGYINIAISPTIVMVIPVVPYNSLNWTVPRNSPSFSPFHSAPQGCGNSKNSRRWGGTSQLSNFATPSSLVYPRNSKSPPSLS